MSAQCLKYHEGSTQMLQCPNCSAAVFHGASDCPSCGAVFLDGGRFEMPRSRLELPGSVAPAACLRRWKIHYTVWMAVMPTIVFVAVFGSLCAYECTAAPWYTFIVAPVFAFFIGVVLLATYWARAAQLGDEHGRSLRQFVLWSVIWAPILGGTTFYVALLALTSFTALLG